MPIDTLYLNILLQISDCLSGRYTDRYGLAHTQMDLLLLYHIFVFRKTTNINLEKKGRFLRPAV